MAEIAVVGLDIGKRLFHLVGMDRAGRVVLRRRCSRSQVFALFERLPPALSAWRRAPARTSSAAPSATSATTPA